MLTAEQVVEKIDRFTQLVEGWYGRGSIHAPLGRAHRAQELVKVLMDAGYSKLEAFPGVGGQIQVCAFKDGWWAEVNFDDDNEVSISIDRKPAQEPQ